MITTITIESYGHNLKGIWRMIDTDKLHTTYLIIQLLDLLAVCDEFSSNDMKELINRFEPLKKKEKGVVYGDSEFEKQFPKPELIYGEHSENLPLWKSRKVVWLAALTWVISRRDFYINEKHYIGTGAASQTMADIEKEIEKCDV